jgi:hypothetical protein
VARIGATTEADGSPAKTHQRQSECNQRRCQCQQRNQKDTAQFRRGDDRIADAAREDGRFGPQHCREILRQAGGATASHDRRSPF